MQRILVCNDLAPIHAGNRCLRVESIRAVVTGEGMAVWSVASGGAGLGRNARRARRRTAARDRGRGGERGGTQISAVKFRPRTPSRCPAIWRPQRPIALAWVGRNVATRPAPLLMPYLPPSAFNPNHLGPRHNDRVDQPDRVQSRR